MKQSFDFIFLGKISYDQGLKAQKRIHSLCLQGEINPTFIVLEHTPVITLGNRANKENILCSEQALKAGGIDLHFSDRGGDVTCHMPGQLVVYPILPLKKLQIGVKDYVKKIEESLIELLSSHQVKAYPLEGQPGVWVSGKKIASIGIRVKDRITLHGLAFNLKNDLSLFQKIIPCGIKDCSVTSLKESSEKAFSLDQIGKELITLLAYNLGGVLSESPILRDILM